MRIGILLAVAATAAVSASAGTVSTGVQVFAAFDIETTGFSPAEDRIIEIGIVRFTLDSPSSTTTNWLVNPGRPIPPQATQINGISDNDVKDAPVFASVYPLFKAFAGNAVLVAHQAGFDDRFLRAECGRAGLAAITNRVLDTLSISRKCWPDAPGHSLSALVDFLNLQEQAKHRGLSDAFCAKAVFEKAVQINPTLLSGGADED